MRTTNNQAPQRPPFQFAKLWLILGWMLISIVVVLSLWPKSPQIVDSKLRSDLGHLFAYMLLMLWFANIYPQQRHKLWLGAAFTAMGICLEYLQGMIGDRKFQYTDMLANSFGVVLGWALVKSRLGTCLSYFDILLSRAGQTLK